MVEHRTKKDGHSSHLYYSSDNGELHLVPDDKDKLYLQYRTNEPLKVIFTDNITCSHQLAQIILREGT